jgi:signal transduction histidine kinase
MNKLSKKMFINALLLIALIISTSAGMISYSQIQQAITANNWVIHTYDVMAKARLLLVTLVRADLKARNFIITGDDADIKTIDSSIQFMNSSVTEMRHLTDDNPRQQKNITDLKPMLTEKFNFLNNMLEKAKGMPHPGNVDPEISLANTTATENILSYVTNSIVGEEQQLLQQRINTLDQQTQSAKIKVILTTVISDILILLSFILINYYAVIGIRAVRSRDELENHLKKIIDGSSDLIAAVDADLNYIAFNKAYERKYRRTFGNTIKLGDNVRDALAKMTDNQEIINAWSRAVNGDELTLVSRWRPSDSDYFEITFNPIHDSDDKVIGAMHIMRDITERMKIDQLKNEFVSIVSHELRTPLTSIRGSLGLLVGGAVGNFDEKTKKMLNIAYSNSERLIRLINDILDIEKMESGKVDFQLAPLDLHKIIEESIASNQPYCEKFDVSIKLNKSPKGIIVYADYGRLMQVLTNLISNAVKFSHQGGEVSINITTENKIVRVSITDQGEGIPEEFQKYIFQKFAQADPSAIRKQSGTGLGLSISKAIIEKLEGTIGFTTTHGEGTTFYFDLPIWKEGMTKSALVNPVISSKKVPEPRPISTKGLKVLYVEDDLDLSQIVLNILLNEAEITTVQTSHQALEILSKEKFDLVLLDLVLPDGYGADLIPEVTKQQTPIVIFSAYELPQKYVPFVAKTLIKSKTTNQELIQTIRDVSPGQKHDSTETD